MDYLLRKYPDLDLIGDIYNEMVLVHNKADPGIQGDEKYRPLTVLLAVLYKLQVRNDTFFTEAGTKLCDGTGSLVELLGFLWHHQHVLGKKIREKINSAETREEVEALLEKNKLSGCLSTGLLPEDVPVVWVSELGQPAIEEHCPDHVLTVHKDLRCVILTILGTRIFPRPAPQDIIMDLAARAVPFEGGEAHSGMAIGARNLLAQSGAEISRVLEENEDFKLLIVGYSLGAGIAQLVTLSLLNPEGSLSINPNRIRCVAYGCPPVYGTNQAIPQIPNILVVQNNNDGISGASMKSINDVFLKTRAIHRLNLKRRTLFRMALTRNRVEESPESSGDAGSESQSSAVAGSESQSSAADSDEDCKEVEEALDDAGISDTESEQSEQDKQEKSPKKGGFLSSFRETISSLTRPPSKQKWDMIEDAVGSIPETKQPRLYQIGQNVLVLKKNDQDEITIKKFTTIEETSKFSEKVRFKPSMFDDHMPWSYNALFKDVSCNNADLNLEILDSFMDYVEPIEMQDDAQDGVQESAVLEPQNGAQGSFVLPKKSPCLYPDLSQLGD